MTRISKRRFGARGGRRAGFTLVEVIIVVTLIGILSLVGPTLLVRFQEFYLLNVARNDTQRDARLCNDLISRFLGQAVIGTVMIDTPTGEAPSSRIQFRHKDGRLFNFRRAGSALYQIINGSPTVVSRNLVYLSFSYPRSDDPTVIAVAVSMGKPIYRGRRKHFDLTISKVQLSNQVQ